jgi:hypothetical protein
MREMIDILGFISTFPPSVIIAAFRRSKNILEDRLEIESITIPSSTLLIKPGVLKLIK